MKYPALAALLLAAPAGAFVVPSTVAGVRSAEHSATSLGPGFLKDLGFEKPSWLPDFGGKKEEAAAEDPAPAAEGEEAEESAEVVAAAEE